MNHPRHCPQTRSRGRALATLTRQRAYHQYKHTSDDTTRPKAQIHQIHQDPPIQSNKIPHCPVTSPRCAKRGRPIRARAARTPPSPSSGGTLSSRTGVFFEVRVVSADIQREKSKGRKGERHAHSRTIKLHPAPILRPLPQIALEHDRPAPILPPRISHYPNNKVHACRSVRTRIGERGERRGTHQPTTAVQYTSGGANMRSSRRRTGTLEFSAEEGGRTNTVSDFSSVSQCAVRSGSCVWKLDRSAFGFGLALVRDRGGEGEGAYA